MRNLSPCTSITKRKKRDDEEDEDGDEDDDDDDDSADLAGHERGVSVTVGGKKHILTRFRHDRAPLVGRTIARF